jgi:rubredoxin
MTDAMGRREFLKAAARGTAGMAAAAEDETVTEAEGTSAQGWRCRVCGYIYEGENLPDDYACPVCGAGPDQFEKL